MAAPAVTVRQTPAGIMLDDGFSTKISFAADPDVSFWEKSVKPPGMDGGDPIDQTTMHSVAYRVQRARALKTITPITGKAGYDPAVATQIDALINIEGAITVTYPDGSTDSIFGYLKSVEYDELAEGTLPELTFTIQPTMYDPVNHVEAGRSLVSVAGT